ncbi:hypothetical protein vec25_08 [Escherichia phage VEc25]|uniref:Uncharacterized protein n=2 Tax=Enquatrovirus N4 TaxID=10752 RepID=A0A7T1NDG9_9CAUD|nr:hypothetical protein AC3HA13_080 [Escherichia phage vB_EcoP_3HA13]QPN96274.1 hypothetical protein vec25_08 [Escherichia phage VEc25]
MEQLNYGYKIKRNQVRGSWLFLIYGKPIYELHRGEKSKTYYVTHIATGKTPACAGLLRDAIMKACMLEGLL